MALFVDIEKKLGNFHLRAAFETGDDVLALLGPSGCGKSMTLKCIAGIERPDRGRIILDGRTLFDSERHINLPPQKRRAGYLFQEYALFPNMTAEQNIACGVRNQKDGFRIRDGGSLRQAHVREIMEKMGLHGLEKKKPHQLSGGQKQRVALARILVNEPDLLLLDEPFSALDSHLRFQMEEQVRRVIEAFGKTVVFVSHDRDEVFRLCSRIGLMRDGRLEACGEKHEVFRDPRTVNGARLTGCKNISPIEVMEDGRVYARDWGLALRMEKKADGITHIGIRMHDLVPLVHRGSGDDSEKENTFRFRVAEEVESPFSVTVMLLYEKEESQGRPGGRLTGRAIGIAISKEVWARIRGPYLDVRIPSEAILPLRE